MFKNIKELKVRVIYIDYHFTSLVLDVPSPVVDASFILTDDPSPSCVRWCTSVLTLT